MPLTLSGIFSNLNAKEKELDRAIAKIALLRGINTAERRQVALKTENKELFEKKQKV